MKEEKKKTEIVQINSALLRQFGLIDKEGSVETNKLIRLKDGEFEFVDDNCRISNMETRRFPERGPARTSVGQLVWT